MKEFLVLILGGMSTVQLLAGIFYLVIGIILSLFIDANKRNVASQSSPIHFSYKHLLKDNNLRITISLVVGIVCLRFCNEFFGSAPTMYMAFMIGFSADKLSEYIKKLTIK